MAQQGRTRVTSKDVARLAGVSQSAVSRVFTAGRSVSPKTREKVHACAEQLGYRPNVLARGLITGQSRIIGVVAGYLENQFYPEAIRKLTASLQTKGYHTLIFITDSKGENMDDILSEILDYKVDGLVIASVTMSSVLARRCLQEGIPVVLFNRAQEDESLNAVSSHNYHGGKKVAEHLSEIGCRRPGYIAGLETTMTQRDREMGFINGLESKGLAITGRAIGNFDFAEARLAAKTLFGRPDPPDCVFVANDHMAFAVLDTLRHDLGLRVPEDVCVVGYDDVPIAAWPSYNLTTVRQPINQMVEETVSILMQAIDHPTMERRRIYLDGPLKIRATTRPLPEKQTDRQTQRN